MVILVVSALLVVSSASPMGGSVHHAANQFADAKKAKVRPSFNQVHPSLMTKLRANHSDVQGASEVLQEEPEAGVSIWKFLDSSGFPKQITLNGTATRHGSTMMWDFPACKKADGTVDPCWLTDCMGYCGSGCASEAAQIANCPNAEAESYKNTQVWSTSCNHVCLNRDLCVYARDCPGSYAESHPGLKCTSKVMTVFQLRIPEVITGFVFPSKCSKPGVDVRKHIPGLAMAENATLQKNAASDTSTRSKGLLGKKSRSWQV